MHIAPIRSLVSTALLLCAAPLGHADNAWDGHILSFIWENDAIARSDRHYTQGAGFSYLSKDDELPQWLTDFSNWLPSPGFAVGARKFGLGVHQEIYTPEDLQTPTLVVDDRPYAGWLYGTATLQRRGRTRHDFLVMEHLKMDFGVVGPPSLAEETQKSWHGVEPQGWDNQLNTEPGINLRYDWSILFPLRSKEGPWGGDFIPFGKTSLGNVHTFFGVGSTFRFGYNVPNEFEFSYEKEPAKWGAYLFTSTEGRFVIRNIFLDGNSFRDSHSVDKRHFVGDVRAGVTIVLKHVEITAAHTFVSQEFKEQKTLDSYGTAMVTVKF